MFHTECVRAKKREKETGVFECINLLDRYEHLNPVNKVFFHLFFS